jgi:hypothetical protein
MKKLFTFILSALVCTLVMAERPTGVVQKADATTKPVIDGAIDDLWANVTKFNVDKPFQSEVPTFGDEGTTYFKMLWDEAGLYVLVVANDDAWFPFWAPGGGANSWEYDKIELYFDTNYILADGVGGQGGTSGNRQIAPDTDAAHMAGEQKTATVQGGDVIWATVLTDPTWTTEYFVPWESIPNKDGVMFDKTAQMGFDVTLIDRDPGDAARKRAQWANVGAVNENWNNMDDAGYLTLEGAEPGIYVDGITLTGGDITTDNGTLQMTPVIDPVDATTQTLKWTIEPGGTGKASINAKTGLVTAIADGTVKVKAAATDGGWAESNIVTINISGQVVKLTEINMLKNSYFELGTDGKESWGGPGTVDGSYYNIVCTPKTNIWDTMFGQPNIPIADATTPYTVKFKAVATADMSVPMLFEDRANGNNKVVTSLSEYRDNGYGKWDVPVTTEAKWYTIDVIFSALQANSAMEINFQVGQADGTLSLDSIMMFADADLALVNSAKVIAANSLKVYPNPVGSANQLNVNLPSAGGKVAIYNALGQKLVEKEATGTLVKFDVANLRKGMYFVKLSDGTTQKFIR